MSTTYDKSRNVQTKLSLFIILAFVFGIVLVAVYGVLWRRFEPVQNRNVILIVLDTVRADRLGCYGNQAGITHEIDKFASGAIRFEKAFSHAPWTLPSVASLFTSQYPVQHGAGGRLGAFRILNDDAVTIAEVFKQAGLVTGSITNVLFLTKKFGMAQGFETIDATVPKNNTLVRLAGPTTEAALRWLEEHKGKPFFLFVHYFDPHLTYDPPQPFRERFAGIQDVNSNNFLFGTVRDMIGFRRGLIKLDPEKIKRLEKLHNGEVAYVDHEVGKLLDGISQRGLDDNTIIVLTSDHGEEFGDHDGFEHGHTHYDELLHVPLIIRVPGIRPNHGENRLSEVGVTITATVRQIDIAPTLCEFLDIQPDPTFVGKSLVALMHGQKENDRPVLSQGNMWGPSGIGWRQAGFKLIRRSPTSPYQLFDLIADPQERKDLSAEAPERCADIAKELELVLEGISAQHVRGQTPNLTDEQIQKLRSLGYLK